MNRVAVACKVNSKFLMRSRLLEWGLLISCFRKLPKDGAESVSLTDPLDIFRLGKLEKLKTYAMIFIYDDII